MNKGLETGTITGISKDQTIYGEAFYKILFKNNYNIILLIDPITSRIEDCNLAACSFYGYSYEEMMKLKISEINIFTEEQIQEEMNLARSEQRNEFYFKHRLSSGLICDVAVNSTPITIENKMYLFSIVIDASKNMLYKKKISQYYSKLEDQVIQRTHEITELNKILEKGIEESEERFRATFEQASVGICHTSLDGRFLMVNKKACDIIGYTTEELLQMNFPDISFAEDFMASMDIKKNLLEGNIDNHTLEKRYIKKDGSVIWLQLTISLMYDNNAQPIRVITVVQDITDKKLMEMRLKTQKDKLEAIIENMPDAFAFYNKEGQIILLNAEARRLHPKLNPGLTIEEVHDGYEYFDLDNNPMLQENLPTRRVFRGEKVRNERIALKQEDNIRIIEINATPVFDDRQNLISAVVSHRDVTENFEKDKEIRRQQEQLLKVEHEKNEALEKALESQEEFFANISHELKTPLNVIFATSQLLDLYCTNGSLADKKGSIIRYIEAIKQNSYRLSKLINNIVDLSKIQAGFFELDLSNNNIVEVVEEIVMSVTNFTKVKGLNIIFDTDTEEKIIACDPEKIERIILNLISNAVKFSNEGDEIFVDIKNKDDAVEISVMDNGIGIKDIHQDMIFERFKQVDKSLSRNAEGTGIGLSIVKSIVELHGGQITVDSEFGKGSKFTVILPTRKVIMENIILSSKIRDQAESIQIELSDICS